MKKQVISPQELVSLVLPNLLQRGYSMEEAAKTLGWEYDSTMEVVILPDSKTFIEVYTDDDQKTADSDRGPTRMVREVTPMGAAEVIKAFLEIARPTSTSKVNIFTYRLGYYIEDEGEDAGCVKSTECDITQVSGGWTED